MKKRSILRRHWLTLVILVLFFFWIGFFVTEYIYNVNFSKYNIEFVSDKITINDISEEFFLEGLKKRDKDGNFTGEYSY